MDNLDTGRRKKSSHGLEITSETLQDLATRLDVSPERLTSMSRGMKSTLLKARRLLIDIPERQISHATDRDYRRKVAYLEELAGAEPGSLSISQLPKDHWTAKRSWYAYRAALLHLAREAVEDGYSVLKDDHPERQPDARQRLLRMKNAIRILETYPPDIKGTESLFAGEQGDWRGQLSPKSSKPPKNARRRNLRPLNQLGDWIGMAVRHCIDNVDKKTEGRTDPRQTCPQTRPRSNARNVDMTMVADLVSVLAATGARPVELLRGVALTLDGDRIGFLIQGAKFKDENARLATGHRWRQVSITTDAPEGAYLFERLRASGGTMQVGADFAPAAKDRPRELRRLIAAVGREALGAGVSLSPYDFRHAVSARAKAADELSDAEIAMLLGQRSTRTQSNYGMATQRGSGQRSKVVSVQASHSVRHVSERKRGGPDRGYRS